MIGMRETCLESPQCLVRQQVFSPGIKAVGGFPPCGVTDDGVTGFLKVETELLSPPSFRFSQWSLVWPICMGSGVAGLMCLGEARAMIGLVVLTHLLQLQRTWMAMLISDSRKVWSSLPASSVKISALRPWQNAVLRTGSLQLLSVKLLSDLFSL